MEPGDDLRRLAGAAFFAAILAISLSLPASAVARSASGRLSPRLAELAKPSLRSEPPAQQAARLSLAAKGPGSLLRSGDRVLVEVRFDGGAGARAAALRAAGARVVNVSNRYQTVTVAARPADLHRLAAVAGVRTIDEVLTPMLAATSCEGLVTSQGDGQLNASQARSAFNVDGSGVTVGILSDSFDTDETADTHAGEDVASGDLPGPENPCGRTSPVAVLEDLDEPGETLDEGRAMAQVVHDLAPGASLAFATAFNGELSFAQNIRTLAATGSDLIVDDVLYLGEPFFQDGPIAAAVDDVAAAGATYFSAAGNNNLISGENDIASWEAPGFRDAAACPPELEAIAETEVCMDFDPGPGEDPTFGIAVEAGETLTVDLQWAEPWEGVTADLDAFLLDSEDKPIPAAGVIPVVGSYTNNVGGEEAEGTQRPLEVFSWENESEEPQEVRLAINRCFGAECNPDAGEEARPRVKFALLQNGSGVSETEYPTGAEGDIVGPTIFGHSAAAGALGVAAVPVDDSSTVEPYSSRGPVTHYFGPVNGASPAPEIEEPRGKPDLAASDCGLTTFFFPTVIPGIHLFCGTSAAGPHAAAVAALALEANPSLSLAQLRTALATTARPIGGFGPEAVGAGLVDAFGAVSRVALPPEIEITDPPPQLTNDPRPGIGFSANRPVTFFCSLDGGALLPCASPYQPPTRLNDGPHGFLASGTDTAGRSGSSEVVTFTVDTVPPKTFFRKRPRKRIRSRQRRAKAVFRFGSNEKGADFICRVDGGLFRFCPQKFVRRFRPGRHVMRVKARDLAGNVDPSPAVYRFRVKLRRRGR